MRSSIYSPHVSIFSFKDRVPRVSVCSCFFSLPPLFRFIKSFFFFLYCNKSARPSIPLTLLYSVSNIVCPVFLCPALYPHFSLACVSFHKAFCELLQECAPICSLHVSISSFKYGVPHVPAPVCLFLFFSRRCFVPWGVLCVAISVPPSVPLTGLYSVQASRFPYFCTRLLILIIIPQLIRSMRCFVRCNKCSLICSPRAPTFSRSVVFPCSRALAPPPRRVYLRTLCFSFIFFRALFHRYSHAYFFPRFSLW